MKSVAFSKGCLINICVPSIAPMHCGKPWASKNCLLPHTLLVLILVIWCAQARGRLKCICKLFAQFQTLRSFPMPDALISNLALSLLVRYIVQSYSYLLFNINCRSHNCRLLLQKRFDLVTKFHEILLGHSRFSRQSSNTTVLPTKFFRQTLRSNPMFSLLRHLRFTDRCETFFNLIFWHYQDAHTTNTFVR